jgi:hypothetical protein
MSEEMRFIDVIGYRVKIWLYSQDETLVGDCVSIFNLLEEYDGYFLGINFEGETDVIGIDLEDIRMIKRLKRTNRHLTVVHVNDLKNEKKETTDSN